MSGKTVKASIIIGGSVSGAFRSAMSSAKSGLKAIGEEIANVERKQRLMGRSIDTFGRMGKNVDGLRHQYARLAREADSLKAAQLRLANVQERIDRNTERRRALGSELRGAVGTLGVVAAATIVPIRSAVQFENAMLGVAKQLNGARDASGALTPVYFRMTRQVQQLGREIPLATNELADMVAAGLRMGVAEDQVVSFTRTAAMMADAFELPAGQLADDMGKIAGLFHIPIPRIGELADAINYLDDNAISKGGEIIDVMRRIGGMAQALKMPAKEAAALGSTFLTLGSSAEIAGTASNAVLRILGAATAQSKRVRAGMQSLGLDPEAVQRGMAKDATGTILMVLDKLNALNDEQRMVAATRLFGAEYGDDVAKLATGADEYRRQLQLVNGEQQKGSMSREFSARLKTTAAQWQITKNRMSEVAVVVGGALLPAINELMASAAPMIERFADWSRENPRVIKGVVGTALALSGLRVVTTGVAYAWTAVQGPVLSVMGFIARWRATGALAAMGRFGPMAMRIAGVMRTVGAAIGAIGGGPIAVAAAAIVGAALLVRKYWEPISAFMSGVWSGFSEAVAPAIGEVMRALAPLKPAWDEIVASVSAFLEPLHLSSAELGKFAAVGRVVGQVIANSFVITLRIFAGLVTLAIKLKDAVGAVVTSIKGAMGTGLLGKFVNTAAAFIPGASLVLATGAAPASPRSPVAMPAAARGRAASIAPSVAQRGGGGVVDSSTHTYHITQQPGESQEALAQRIEAERRRRSAVDRRGSLVDGVSP